MKDEFHMKLKCEASERVGVRSPESECLHPPVSGLRTEIGVLRNRGYLISARPQNERNASECSPLILPFI